MTYLSPARGRRGDLPGPRSSGDVDRSTRKAVPRTRRATASASRATLSASSPRPGRRSPASSASPRDRRRFRPTASTVRWATASTARSRPPTGAPAHPSARRRPEHLPPWATVCHLHFIGLAGADAPDSEHTNVRADFSVSGAMWAHSSLPARCRTMPPSTPTSASPSAPMHRTRARCKGCASAGRASTGARDR